MRRAMPPAARPPRLPLLLAVATLACSPGGQPAADFQAQQTQSPPPVAVAAPRAELPAAQLAESRRTALTEAVRAVAPAVVTVQTEVLERAPVDPFELFFGGRSGNRTRAGIGSGFIVRADGVIVTNAHVVAGATKIAVALRDGTTYPAELVGADEANDLAVLRIAARDLPVATLGRSDDLLVGEWAVAIGNPYGFLLGNTEPSVTVGVISGVGRNLVGGGEEGGVYVDMIRTDASINPGNSGGPLVNAAGQVIGVNSSIYTPSGGSIGLGFAIPINRVRRVTDDLLEHGQVRRPWIGIKPELPATNQGLSRAQLAAGVTVAAVTPGSPADKAGLRVGDVLLRTRERPLRNPFDWEAVLLETRPGETLPLTVRRDGRERSVSVTVADLPEVSAPKVQVLRELELVTLTPAIRAERGIRAARGAVVYRASDRIRDELGLQPGDVVVQINRTRIETAADVSRVLEAAGGRRGYRLFFERGGRVYTTDFIVQ
jgi:serine protease Do